MRPMMLSLVLGWIINIQPLFAQKSSYQRSAALYAADPAAIFTLPALNNDSLWQAELRQRQPGRPNFFCDSYPPGPQSRQFGLLAEGKG